MRREASLGCRPRDDRTGTDGSGIGLVVDSSGASLSLGVQHLGRNQMRLATQWLRHLCHDAPGGIAVIARPVIVQVLVLLSVVSAISSGIAVLFRSAIGVLILALDVALILR